jgi:hypothetical protein
MNARGVKWALLVVVAVSVLVVVPQMKLLHQAEELSALRRAVVSVQEDGAVLRRRIDEQLLAPSPTPNALTGYIQCHRLQKPKHEPSPNVVHLIKSDRTFSWVNFLQILSIKKFVNPSAIIVHHEDGIADNCWLRMVKPYLTFSRINFIRAIGPYAVTANAHFADFARFWTLCKYGGIYLDMDSFPIKSFQPLLDFGRPIVANVCEGSGGRLGMGALVAPRGDCFMCEVYRSMFNAFDGSWIKHSMTELEAVADSVAAAGESSLRVLAAEAFHTGCWTDAGMEYLWRSEESSPRARDDVFSVHVWNHAGQRFLTKLLPSTLREVESAAHYAMRLAMPDWLEDKHVRGAVGGMSAAQAVGKEGEEARGEVVLDERCGGVEELARQFGLGV